jgi:hypothetical protein
MHARDKHNTHCAHPHCTHLYYARPQCIVSFLCKSTRYDNCCYSNQIGFSDFNIDMPFMYVLEAGTRGGKVTFKSNSKKH